MTRDSSIISSRAQSIISCCLLLVLLEPAKSLIRPSHQQRILRGCQQYQEPTTSSSLCMVAAPLPRDGGWSNNNKRSNNTWGGNNNNNAKRKVRQKYKRKRMPATEKERRRLTYERQAQYEALLSRSGDEAPSIWSFECLFPKAVLDEEVIERDLNEVKKRDAAIGKLSSKRGAGGKSKQRQLRFSILESPDEPKTERLKTSAIGGSSMMRVWREPKLSSFILPYDAEDVVGNTKAFLDETTTRDGSSTEEATAEAEAVANILNPTLNPNNQNPNATLSERLGAAVIETNKSGKVDMELTRMVEDRMYGYRRGNSLLKDGAIQFREGVRLGNPLPVNAARLNYHAKMELRSHRVEEAQELYEEAIRIDPRDGRAYLGLSRCAERRRDYKLAKECLKAGITNAVSVAEDGTPDIGANPFLLQALGCLEEKAGHLNQAEALFIEAARSRPSHAASWVALAQLRTEKFRQSAMAGRVCYQTAARELEKAGMKPSAHVFTAWAAMEYKKEGDVRRARKLFQMALKADKRCSAAWLQLGCMEAKQENWQQAEISFETCLKFDKRNSRVLQAYAIMESKRPKGNSRKVIDLFERALKVNKRDAGVLQPYAIYVAELGDVEAARDLFERGTKVNRRHAPVWQAWGVFETRQGNPEAARNIFQQGIWACAPLGGGQSGGYKCARLWQAWGVLEAQEGDDAAARRCFNRAVDADKRNIAAYRAWTMMEEELGNWDDARSLFEWALQQFEPGTVERKQMWQAYELMEQNAGNPAGATGVYQRSMREVFKLQDTEEEEEMESEEESVTEPSSTVGGVEKEDEKLKEYDVMQWDQGSSNSMKAEAMETEVWLNNGSIEGKVPTSTMKKKRTQKQESS
eukprot:CAMPEP_0113649192 /NCGR_PEP_ID=MMETSP0017_2-20120614/26130_1 /TAXON_ID=2856 /ORGANISM="Cylindrotheca closterium" /LENGTH=864 /DNA_ID=CAMNT_0000561533 /DNA_START=103 /DNA_END=2697 /DNA_ORIENTATION=+ /assembly_acc=CAM_ASM_000147